MTLSEELTWRGFVNQTSYPDISAIDGDPITFYWGVDPSADSMHIGQLAMAMMIRHFIAHGHKAILLVGGATGMIGDPDGKDSERDLKPLDEIDRNKTAIAAQYRSLFAGLDFETVDNYDWFKQINYLDFLREVGKHFSLTQLLDRDFVKSRIGDGGSGISYAEFSYSLIQGYDFLHLYRDKGATLQLAGADQWGNSISGVQLIRKIEGGDANIWTAPLVINKQTGKKFGKSEGGAIWLDATKTSPYAFYQFWLNVDDSSVIDYVKLYTTTSPDEVDRMASDVANSPETRAIHRHLAREVTVLVHGEDVAYRVENVSSVLFGQRPFEELDEQEIDLLAQEIPVVRIGSSVTDALVESGIAASRGEARRLIEGGAISLNGIKTADDQTLNELRLIKKGKNTFILVR